MVVYSQILRQAQGDTGGEAKIPNLDIIRGYIMKNITVFAKPTPRAKAIEKNLLHQLKANKVEPEHPIIITVGGDGTTLMAIKQYIDTPDISFVGISAGHLGFLQTLDEKDIPLLIETLIKNSFTTRIAPLVAVSYASHRDEVLGY